MVIKASDNDIKWVKVRTCNNGHQRRILEVRVSESSNNPSRLYYKCRICEYFRWLIEDDVKRGDYEDEVNQGQPFSPRIGRELCDLKEQVHMLQEMVIKFAKIGFILCLVILVVCIKV